MVGFLYGQTEYNMLECSLRLNDYINQASLYGFKALSITDHNMYGHLKFYHACKEKKIKPIIGLEINVESTDSFKNVFICYAKNIEGYKALLELSTLDKIENKVYSLDELSKYKGLIYISTDVSDIYRLSNQSSFNSLINTYIENLPSFGVGISMSNKGQISTANLLRDLSYEYGYKIYPLSQTLYNNSSDEEVYESLMKIGNNSFIKKGDYHFRNQEELEEDFFMLEDSFKNFEELVNEIDFEINNVEVSLPKYPKTDGKESNVFLQEMCEKGLKRRFQKESHATFEEYLKRLNYELSVIHSMGYDDYFLIVWDFVLYAKKSGIMVGPGRGSAAGSLVSFCLGITNVDPIKFDLLFERFLNPERVSMPDIDMDFPDDRRDEVITYVKNLYGEERVCNISAFGTFQIKSSLRDLGRVLKIKSSELDIIVKIASTTDNYDKLVLEYSNNEEIYKLLTIAKKIENLPRHISTHAAGIILSNDKLIKNVALQPGLNGLYQSQLESYDLAGLGLLKIDFLGIRNLNIINQICSEIPGMNNISIQDIPLDDKKTYDLLAKGDTLGVFQLESEGIKKVLRELKPSEFDDIVAVLSLYRPGPMDNIGEFIARKNGKPFEYLHPNLEPILKSTYGIIVYQEQIMKIAYEFAGLSLGEADVLRRAVSKKDKNLLDANRKRFVEQAAKKGYKENITNQIYDYIVKFANYGFNKSHSVAYSILAYQMAYFKANYFSIFMAKILNNVIGNTTTIISYIDYAKKHGILVNKPDINEASLDFIAKNNCLIYPLTGVFGIGQAAAKEIVKERINGPYLSYSDFKKRVPSINQNMIESLVYAGAFDSFGHTKKSMIDESDDLSDVFNQMIPESERITKVEDEFEFDTLRVEEQKALGFNIDYDYFKNIIMMQKQYHTVFLSKKFINQYVDVIVEFKELKTIKTKKGDNMFVGKIFDGRIDLSFVAFPKAYENISNIIDQKNLFKAHLRLVKNEDKNRFEAIIDNISRL